MSHFPPISVIGWFGCTAPGVGRLTAAACRRAEYVNSDDCWMLTCRNPALAAKPPRSPCDSFKGPQRFDPERFPDGIEAVVKHVHSRGLKFGLCKSTAARASQPARIH